MKTGEASKLLNMHQAMVEELDNRREPTVLVIRWSPLQRATRTEIWRKLCKRVEGAGIQVKMPAYRRNNDAA